MAVVYRWVGILIVDVIFFRSLGIFHSEDSFPSTFRPRLWETSSGVVAVRVFDAAARRELWAHPSRLHLIYVVHAYCCYVIGQHSDNWNLIGRFLYRCVLWSEVLLSTFSMRDTKFYVFYVLCKTWYYTLKMCKIKPLITKSSNIETDQSGFSCPSAGQSRSSSTHAPRI